MFRLTLRSLATHRARLFLTSVAVVLGTAFVAGTIVFTATLQRTFDELINTGTADVVVEPDTQVTAWSNGARLVSDADYAAVSRIAGAGDVQGTILVDGVQVIGPTGTAIGVPGAPAFGIAWEEGDLSDITLVDGQAPQRDGEVAVDTQTAAKADLQVGDTVRLVTPGPALRPTVVGLMRYGSSGNLAGATMTAFDPATARSLLLGDRPGYTAVSVKGTGLSPDELAARVRSTITGADLKVSTGAQLRSAAQQTVTDSLAFISALLLVFAGIALLVGSFLVFNTFSVLVAQRTRDLAMLRALGVTRRQLMASVLGEAFLVGLVGGTFGLALGLLLARGIQSLFGVIGMDMPYTGLTVTWQAVAGAYAVAVVVTGVAAYLPARRASRIAPVAAMRDVTTVARRPLGRRTAVGAGALVVGAGILLAGAVASPSSLSAVGLGAVVCFVGGVLTSPWLASRTLAAASRLARGRTVAGRIALENGRRNPRRTATTASALMIGLLMVSAFGVFGASSTASSDAAIDRTMKADFVVVGQSGRLFSPVVAERVAATPGVALATSVTAAPALVDGEQLAVTGVDPRTITEVVPLELTGGDLSGLARGGVVVDDKTAAAHGWTTDSRVTMGLPAVTTTVPVVGIYRADLGLGGIVADRVVLVGGGWPDQDSMVFARLSPGADATVTGTALTSALSDFPNVALRDRTQQKDAMRAQIQQMLAVVYAMLALAVVIALLGIINTLALSIVERTREIGLLRAVGATRRQIRRMVTWESVTIALYGSILGAALGLLVGLAFSYAMRDEGITTLTIPWTTLVAVVLLACVLGLVAAVLPARRASRLDILGSIAES